MVQLRRLRSDDSLKEVIQGVNRIFDALLGNYGGRVHLIDDDGELLDTIGGASLGTSEPSLKVRSGIGEHGLFQHSNGTDTILEIQDSGVTALNLTIGQWAISESGDDLIFKEDGGAERVRFGDSASTFALTVTGPASVSSYITPGALSGVPIANSLYQGAIVKGWAVWAPIGGTGNVTADASYNVSGIVDNATGDWTVSWNLDFASANYAVVVSVQNDTLLIPRVISTGFAAGSVRFKVTDAAAVDTDPARIHVIAIGAQ